MNTNDPTYELTRRPRLPMTPEQLDALRPKPKAEQPVGSEAKRIAYQAGVSALEPLILRLEQVERDIQWLKEAFVAAFGPKV
jgi:hypothetical protein